MASKNRVEGAKAVAEFIRDSRLPVAPGQDAQIQLVVSAKAGDKWRLNRVSLTVDLRFDEEGAEISIPGIGTPFYRSYSPVQGTRFIYDGLKAKLFIEGHLNKGRGDPYVILISR